MVFKLTKSIYISLGGKEGNALYMGILVKISLKGVFRITEQINLTEAEGLNIFEIRSIWILVLVLFFATFY